MKLPANALPLLAILLLALPASAEVVRAPTFTLTGAFTVPVPEGAHNVTLSLDTGQTATATGPGGVLALAGVPDGLRTWHLTFTDALGAQDARGEFSAQDLTPIITAQVERAVEASTAARRAADGAQAAAVEANATAALAVNVSVAARDAARQALAAVQAIPTDLARRGDLAPLAKTSDVADAEALTIVHLQAVAANQTRQLDAARHDLRSLRDAGAFLVGLLLLGLGLLALYLVRLRGELRDLPRMKASAPVPRPPAKADAPAERPDARERKPDRPRRPRRDLSDPGGPHA